MKRREQFRWRAAAPAVDRVYRPSLAELRARFPYLLRPEQVEGATTEPVGNPAGSLPLLTMDVRK